MKQLVRYITHKNQEANVNIKFPFIFIFFSFYVYANRIMIHIIQFLSGILLFLIMNLTGEQVYDDNPSK